ncbi:hypothetical protein GUJ93_ZPchr0004g39884 [Zizania palustris]|uniref:Uncharacterized protein n=1 Tax=Zizania palustris TaxID=103762 RepID=A0A8J5T0N9_ZIZPA|nr:hypothetical protein GUJ93_ZPchr0004g39884 [Zizania palustris]
MESPLSHLAMISSSILFVVLYLMRRALLGNKRKYPSVDDTVLYQLLNFGRLVEYQMVELGLGPDLFGPAHGTIIWHGSWHSPV